MRFDTSAIAIVGIAASGALYINDSDIAAQNNAIEYRVNFIIYFARNVLCFLKTCASEAVLIAGVYDNIRSESGGCSDGSGTISKQYVIIIAAMLSNTVKNIK